MRPPRICLISTFPKLVLVSALSAHPCFHEMSSETGAIRRCSQGNGRQACRQRGEGAGRNPGLPLGRGAGSGPMPAPEPVLLGMGLFADGTFGGHTTACDGTEQSCLQKHTRVSKLLRTADPHPPCGLHNLKSADSV